MASPLLKSVVDYFDPGCAVTFSRQQTGERRMTVSFRPSFCLVGTHLCHLYPCGGPHQRGCSSLMNHPWKTHQEKEILERKRSSEQGETKKRGSMNSQEKTKKARQVSHGRQMHGMKAQSETNNSQLTTSLLNRVSIWEGSSTVAVREEPSGLFLARKERLSVLCW